MVFRERVGWGKKVTALMKIRKREKETSKQKA